MGNKGSGTDMNSISGCEITINEIDEAGRVPSLILADFEIIQSD